MSFGDYTVNCNIITDFLKFPYNFIDAEFPNNIIRMTIELL